MPAGPTPQEREELSSQPENRQGKKRLKLLLAEDNLVNQKLTTSLLEKRGRETIVAATGREAVEV